MRKRPLHGITGYLSPARIIILGFAAVILLGSLILTLPICSREGTFTPYIDALFTSTTSVCVTGLVTVSTVYHWNLLGQIVILVLIQLGGMGVVSAMMMILLMLHRRIGMRNRLLIQQSYGLSTMHGVVSFVTRVIRGMLLVEFLGFLCYLPVLCRDYGRSGVWRALFLSVSAFCNAGMDLLGDNSMAPYVGNVWMNLVTMLLIVLGGLGFMVWWELLDRLKTYLGRSKTGSRRPGILSLHARIVLSSTAFLIGLGMLVILICEFHNPETMGGLGLPGKCMAALFQSVTTRTAGFSTVPQSGLREASSLFCMILMFIGGSPAGTAGGIKTMTVVILGAAIWSEIHNQEGIVLFRRTIPYDYARKALAILGYSFLTWIVCTMILCMVEDLDFLKACYETVSAIGTVGLSKDVTATLHSGGKAVIICLMYAGRIGPVTLATAFLTKGKTDSMIHYADESVLLG
ncbi:MAG: potassium transporter KtrB [Eubacterium sp.]|nr:potassium transporter KtrB [Eubacterium sp.]